MVEILPPDMQQTKTSKEWRNLFVEKSSRVLSIIAAPILRWIIKYRELNRINTQVAYYPVFSSPDELGNHYHRAAWYLPYIEGRCESVALFQSYSEDILDIPPRPDYMCSDVGDLSHLRVYHGTWKDCAKTALQSKVILIWKGYRWSLIAWIAKTIGIPVINIATEDPNTKEYGLYCSLVWKWLLSQEERGKIEGENRLKFENRAAEITAHNYQRSIILGNGPSLETVFNYDLDDAISLICNTTVANPLVMDHVRPHFVAAVDVVSHLGVSIQAEDFRKKLIDALTRYEFTFVTTISFGYLFTLHYPKYKDRIVLINQTTHGTNHDLVANFSAPILDSVLNILMIPLATTFAREVWFLGCDGKSKTVNNEDFWAHARVSGYEEQLVESGHRCHPMFDVHRQAYTEYRYNRSVAQSVETGEKKYGIFFRCLRPSNTPTLKERSMPESGPDEMETGTKITLAEISRWIHEEGNGAKYVPASEPSEAYPDFNPDLPPRLTISQCKIAEDGILRIRGWALAHAPIERIEFYCGAHFLGNAHLGVSRPDVLKKYPEYRNSEAGFVFFLKIDPDIQQDIQTVPDIRFDVYLEEYILISRLFTLQ